MEPSDTVTVIDYELLYRNGVERRFRLYPQAGDTEDLREPDRIILTMKKGAMKIVITATDLVELCRYEFEQKTVELAYKPKTPRDQSSAV